MSRPIFAGFCPRTADAAPVELAAAIARLTGAPLIVEAIYAGGTVLDLPWAGEQADQPRIDARAALQRMQARLGDHPNVSMIMREAASPAGGLGAAIADADPALVVLGSTRRGPIGRVLPGSTAERVIHGAPCPVVVVPKGYEVPSPLSTIGAAFAPTAEGREALRAAASLARIVGASVRAIACLDPRLAEHQAAGLLARQHHEYVGSEDEAAQARARAAATLRDAVAELPGEVAVETDILYQDPADGLAAASSQLDLLVMGSRAYGPVRAVMLGGVTRRMISRAACPLLVLPRGVADPLAELTPAAAAAPSQSA